MARVRPNRFSTARASMASSDPDTSYKVALMKPSRWTRRRVGLLAGAVGLVIAGLAVAAVALGGSADVVVYNGRSQYGDEQAFKAFEDQTGLEVELRGGTAPELFERLDREGDETEADL